MTIFDINTLLER